MALHKEQQQHRNFSARTARSGGSRLLLRAIQAAGVGPLTAEINAGQHVSVIGAGADDTDALLKVICGRSKLNSGEILLDDRPVAQLPESHFGLVGACQPGTEQAIGAVRASLQNGAREARTLHILDICNVSERDLDDTPADSRLTVRLSLASALLNNPPLLVLHDVEQHFTAAHWLQIEEHLRVYRGSIVRFTRDVKALRNASMIWYLADGRLQWVSAPWPLLDAESVEWPAPNWLSQQRGEN